MREGEKTRPGKKGGRKEREISRGRDGKHRIAHMTVKTLFLRPSNSSSHSSNSSRDSQYGLSDPGS